MAQTSVTSYFNNRKRAAGTDESAVLTRNKVFLLEAGSSSGSQAKIISPTKCDTARVITISGRDEAKLKATKPVENGKRKISTRKSSKKVDDSKKQEKIVNFFKMGMLSPRKNILNAVEASGKVSLNPFSSLESISNSERGLKTPTKKTTPQSSSSDLSFEDVKKKLLKSKRLDELKASLKRIDELDQKLSKSQEVQKTENAAEAKSLKEFKTIEVEILSPTKIHKTPVKLRNDREQNEFMSPRKLTPQKLLFSPTKLNIKGDALSPQKRISELPAYKKYQSLAEPVSSGLQLPYKYRCLSEMFKCCESVCAMFYNRQEKITFKKLKPAVQRMLRKNFTEGNLAQVMAIFPNAYKLQQVKMRNYGSTTKQDYYQLVITPNNVDKPQTVVSNEDNLIRAAQNTSLNPQVLIDRQRYFDRQLEDRVKMQHEKFLKSLIPPMFIDRDKIKRWHPEFDLENCPEIEKADIPQPPNVEKFSSAKDILSTARNLFNCATPVERAMDRLEKACNSEETNTKETIDKAIAEASPKPAANTLLKGVPKSLLDKIREKQTAKALDAMTRRPSQDIEARKYGRLPDLARHLRNVYVTERKSILPLELVLEKIGNSYRGILTNDEFVEHMRMIEREFPEWLSFQDIRKTRFVRIAKDLDINGVIQKMDKLIAEKLK